MKTRRCSHTEIRFALEILQKRYICVGDEWAFASRFERIPDNEHHELHKESCTFPSGVYTPSSHYLDWIKDLAKGVRIILNQRCSSSEKCVYVCVCDD